MLSLAAIADDFGHPWNTPLTPDYDMSQFVFVDYYSAVVKLLYLATHRARAYTCHMSFMGYGCRLDNLQCGGN